MERLLARLERRLGWLAPAHLTIWLVGGSGLVYLLLMARPELFGDFTLSAGALARGEVWRLVTFLFLPWQISGGTLGPVWTLFALLFFYMLGTGLEASWGSFRFFAYYLVGVLCTIAASLFVGSLTNQYVNLSVLFAFATVFPEYEILLFLILPVKMKWVGLFSAVGVLYAFVVGSAWTRIGLVVALGNYLLFCAPSLVRRLRGVRAGPRPAAAAAWGRQEPRRARVCALCGKSSVQDPAAEFRVCDCQEKCRGKLTEYCLEHARAH